MNTRNVKYIRSCLVCKRSISSVINSISFCSDECRTKKGVNVSVVSINKRRDRVNGKKVIKGKSWKKHRVKALLKENQNLRNEIIDLKNDKERFEQKKEYKIECDFYLSKEWRELRYKAIIIYKRMCFCCGATNKQIHVDHIKPRSKYPELELDLNNLQLLCVDCNLGKSNKDETDWRKNSPTYKKEKTKSKTKTEAKINDGLALPDF